MNDLKPQTINTKKLFELIPNPDCIFRYNPSDESFIFNSDAYFRIHRVGIYFCVRFSKYRHIVLIVGKYNNRRIVSAIISDVMKYGRVYKKTLAVYGLESPLPDSSELIEGVLA